MCQTHLLVREGHSTADMSSYKELVRWRIDGEIEINALDGQIHIAFLQGL